MNDVTLYAYPNRALSAGFEQKLESVAPFGGLPSVRAPIEDLLASVKKGAVRDRELAYAQGALEALERGFGVSDMSKVPPEITATAGALAREIADIRTPSPLSRFGETIERACIDFSYKAGAVYNAARVRLATLFMGHG